MNIIIRISRHGETAFKLVIQFALIMLMTDSRLVATTDTTADVVCVRVGS